MRSMPRNKCLGQSSTHLGERRGGAGALEVRPIVKLPCAELDVFRGGSTGSAGRLVSRCLGGFALEANRASESATETSKTKGGEILFCCDCRSSDVSLSFDKQLFHFSSKAKSMDQLGRS